MNTMLKGKTVVLAVIACLALASKTAAQSAQPATLDSLRMAYSNALIKIVVGTQKVKDNALDNYGSALEAGLTSLKQKGDIDGYMVVEQEVKRLKSEKILPLGDPNALFAKEVALCQKLLSDADFDLLRRKSDLLRRYIAALGNLVKNLMTQDKIADAKAAGDEKKAMEFVLAENDTGLPQAELRQAATPKLTIIKATFGTPENGLDFTEKVKLMVRNNRLEIPGGLNSIFGDVAPQKKKVFKLDYTDGISTNILHKEGSENDPVVVIVSGATVSVPPESAVTDSSRGGREYLVNGIQYRGTSIGRFKTGDKITVEYVSGKWSGAPGVAQTSPDDGRETAQLVTVNGKSVAVVCDIPKGTKGYPFVYECKEDGSYCIRMKDNDERAYKDNSGAVKYKVTVPVGLH